MDDVFCPHFGTCGGCAVAIQPEKQPQVLPYKEELAAKEARVRGLLSSFDVLDWRPALGPPDSWHYRNKMEFAFSAPLSPAEGLGLSLGLRQAGSFSRVVDLQTCELISPEGVQILRETRSWARQKGLTGYHRKAHVGDLRYLVFREGRGTGERMAVLIATRAPEGLPEWQARVSAWVTTAWLGVTDDRSDTARAKDMRLLWGPGTIDERLDDVTFRISPYSFFQTNTRGTELLYRLLSDWGRSIGGTLVDAYCGSGGITLALARSFDRLVGVDSNAEAIADARFNAQRNGFSHMEFVAEDAVDFLGKLPASKLAVQLSAVVVDPPRPGLHAKALQALLELTPPHLAYVSCNPESLARDLQSLVPFYHIRSAQPVDLFPHTSHIETLVFLDHR